MIYICRRTGLFGPRHLIATQSFTLHRKQSSGNCQKNGYNQRYMKIWKQYILIQNFCWKISPPIYRSIPLDAPVPEFLHFVIHDSFGLTCRWSHLEHVIMCHFEPSTFRLRIDFWWQCTFERIVILSQKSESFGKCIGFEACYSCGTLFF